MSLTAIAILLMLLGFLCVVVGFMMGGEQQAVKVNAKPGRTGRKRGSASNRKAA